MPRQTGQTFVLGGAPNALAQPHHIFDFVLSWTCVSSPMTASYSISRQKFNHGCPRMHTDFSTCFRHPAGSLDGNGTAGETPTARCGGKRIFAGQFTEPRSG